MSLISQVFDHHHDTASNEHSTTEIGTARSNDVIFRKKLGAMKSYSNDTFNRGSTAPILFTIFSSFNPVSVRLKQHFGGTRLAQNYLSWSVRGRRFTHVC